MSSCHDCALALPIAACPTSILVGRLPDGAPPVVVRFTDLATGHVTVAEAAEDALPSVVAVTPFELAPGHSVLTEVLAAGDYGPGEPLEFYPLEPDGSGGSALYAYPVVCVTFRPIKSYQVDGSLYPAGARVLLLDT